MSMFSIPAELYPLFAAIPMFFMRSGSGASCCCDDTQRLYQNGGYPGDPALASNKTYGYDPDADNWTAVTTFGPRYGHNCASLPGFAYAQGGRDTSGTQTQTNSEFDIAANTVTGKTAIPTSVRSRHTSTEFGSLVYAMCGQAGASASQLNQEFDTVADSWASRTSAPTPARIMHAGFLAGDDIIHIVGGSASGGAPFSDHDGYDPTGDSWDTYDNLNSPPRDRISDGGVVGGNGYLTGGADNTLFNNPLSDVDEYDPSGDSWTAKTALGGTRRHHTVKDFGAFVYSVAGDAGALGVATNLNDQYDPAADSHAAKAVYPESMYEHACFR